MFTADLSHFNTRWIKVAKAHLVFGKKKATGDAAGSARSCDSRIRQMRDARRTSLFAQRSRFTFQ